MNYITRHPEGVMTDGPVQLVNSGLKAFVNSLCLEHLSTYDGRRIAARHLLQKRNNVPIYVHADLILIPTHALRHPDCVFLNARNITHHTPSKEGTIVWFLDGSTLSIEIASSHLRLLLDRAALLLELAR